MLNRWFLTDDIPLEFCVKYHHAAGLVVLSYIAAAFAAYTAFHLIARVRAATDWSARLIWLMIASVSMGSGIWAMHFIAMLAVRIPIPVRFDIPLTASSAGFAILASAAAFHLVTDEARSRRRLALAGAVLGAGIGLMHYTGMSALRMPAHVYYDPWLFALSVAVAIVLSTCALYVLAGNLPTSARTFPLLRIGGALVMGLAIVLMHYTGMFATFFYPEPGPQDAGALLDAPVIATAIGCITVLIGILALVAAMFDMRVQQAEALLRDAVESMSEGFVIYDAEDRLTMWNDAYRRMFPTRAQHNRIGMRFEDMVRGNLARGEYPEATGREEEWIAERLRQHHEAAGDVERRLPDGSWGLMTDRRMRNGGIAGLRVDITALKQTQAKLLESERRLRDFANTSSDWFWEQDAELRFSWISDETPLHRPGDRSYLGKRRDELIPHDPADEKWGRHRATLAVRQPFRDFRYSRIGANGTTRHISISGNPVFGDNGTFIGYRGSGRDVTAEVEAAAELQSAKERAEQAEALLRDAVDSIAEGFVIYDQEDRLVMCNDACRNIYAISADSMVRGARFADIIRNGLVRQEYLDAIGNEDEYLRERLRQHIECVEGIEQHLANGTWVLATDRRMRNGGIAGVRIDITALKEAEARLRDSEARLDRAQAIAGVGSWELDLATGRYTWSKELFRIRGLSPDTFQPNVDNVAAYVHPDDYPPVRLWLVDLRNGVERDTIDTRVIRPDGTQRTLHVEGRAVVEADGTIRRVTGTMQDITDRRLIEQQLAQAQKMEAIGNLTGGMAHDFNNVLGVVIGNLELLGRTIGHNKLAEELRIEAMDGALRGAELTRRLLAFARRQPLRPQQTEVNVLVEGIAKLLSRMIGENIELRLRLDAALPPITVDPAQLEAALTNLATNARDAMPEGGRLDITTKTVWLDATYAAQHPEVRPGEYVLIEVSDSGTGISPDVRARIFEPFFTTKELGRGSGLGLSMVFGFIKQSGGHVAVYTEPGRGSTFRLYLPPDLSGATLCAERSDPGPIIGGDETILLVEDNASLRRAAVQQLTGLGYRVREAENAQAALDIIYSGGKIDLLFTDVVMPGGMDGIALAEHASELRPNMKVLIASGFPDVRCAKQRDAVSRFPLLNKPYRQDELARALRERLNEPVAALAEV